MGKKNLTWKKVLNTSKKLNEGTNIYLTILLHKHYCFEVFFYTSKLYKYYCSIV